MTPKLFFVLVQLLIMASPWPVDYHSTSHFVQGNNHATALIVNVHLPRVNLLSLNFTSYRQPLRVSPRVASSQVTRPSSTTAPAPPGYKKATEASIHHWAWQQQTNMTPKLFFVLVQRGSASPANPVSLKELVDESPRTATATKQPECFLCYDNGLETEARLLVFAMKPCLKLLAQSSMWFMEGNFELSPRGFLHLYFILVPLGGSVGSVVSVAYAFMTRKSQEAYEELLASLARECEWLGLSPSPDIVMVQYKVNVVEGAIDNPDQRITQDVDRLCQKLSGIVPTVLVSPFTIGYYSYQSFSVAGVGGPLAVFIYFGLSTIVNKLLIGPVVPRVYELEKQEGRFRYKHAQVRANSESVAFLDGEYAELDSTEGLLARLVSSQQAVYNRQFPLNLCVYLSDYAGSIISFLVLAVPIFNGTYDDVSAANLAGIISKNTFVTMYLMSCFSNLVDLSNAITTVAGNTHRISVLMERMEAIIEEEALGDRMKGRSQGSGDGCMEKPPLERHNQLCPQYCKEQEARGEKKEALRADILAFQGRFAEAAKLYCKAGRNSKAVGMYTDLRMFDLAQEYLGSDDTLDTRQLMLKKAEWARSVNDPRAAAEFYLLAGESLKAVDIAGRLGWVDVLVDLSQKLDKREKAALSLCAQLLIEKGELSAAADVFRRSGDSEGLVNLYVEAGQWDEAFAAVGQQPELKAKICANYANWLAENDRFVDAQKAFYEAGLQDEALRVLERLTQYAVDECRFRDASYYYWLLAKQIVESSGAVDDAVTREPLLRRYSELLNLADIYYVYHNVHRYIEEPFTAFLPEALFNMSRYLLHELTGRSVRGVSLVGVLYALSKQSRNLGAHRLARHCYERLQGLNVPVRFREALDLAALTVRSKPFSDAQDLLPLCYRCSTTNPLVNPRGHFCVNCGQPFIHSFVAFEVLPLVEFQLADGISDKEALELLEGGGGGRVQQRDGRDSHHREIINGYDSMRIDHSSKDDDPFASLCAFQESEDGSVMPDASPVILNRDALALLSPRDVVVCPRSPPLRWRFYRNVVPDVVVVQCDGCAKVFHSDDYEMQTLQTGSCPFCRTKLDEIS
ncbi:intraflagellar transport protein 122 homolog [Ixodes scapularis]